MAYSRRPQSRVRSSQSMRASRVKKKGVSSGSVDQGFSVWRLRFVAGVVFVFAGAIAARLVYLQVAQHGYYEALAKDQHVVTSELLAERGEVFFQEYGSQELFPAAINQKLFLLYAVPRDVDMDRREFDRLMDIVQAPQDILKTSSLGVRGDDELAIESEDEAAVEAAKEEARELRKREAEVQEEERDRIWERLQNKEDLYDPISHGLTDDQREEIEALGFAGLFFSGEDFRFYPEGSLAAHVLGFVGYRDEGRAGQYGIEGFYNDVMEGVAGFEEAEQDVAGRLIAGGQRSVEEARDGEDVVLTIDRVVQHQVERVLHQAVQDFEAEGGTVIVMNPRTGALLAVANSPTFNPNEYSTVDDVGVYTNRAIRELYEPGSVFKPLVMAAAIDRGLVTPSTTYNDEGSRKVDVFTIRNSDRKAHGVTTMTEVLEDSLNLGMMFVAEQLGQQGMYDMLRDYRFDALTGVDGDTESVAPFFEERDLTEVKAATVSFGQGIAITPIQYMQAFSAIANDGVMVRPRLVDAFIGEDGRREVVEPIEVDRVMSSRTAAQVGAMMVSVVERGSGRTAQIDGYRVAGKTGTAQVPNKNSKGYDPDRRIASFAGFAPLEDPQFAILVKLDNPKSAAGAEIWGATTAGPVFRDISEFLLNYYQIPPRDLGDE